jgi:hypothetical protein
MEAMRTARLRLLRGEGQLQVVDDPVYGGIIHDESDDFHLSPAFGTAFRSPL